MARRQDSEDDAVMQHFFGGGRGGGGDINPMALAMQILGLGQKERESERASGLNREEQEALNAYRQATLGQQGEKQASDIELAKLQKQALIDEMAGRREETTARRGFEQAQLGNEQKKAEMAMVAEYIKANPTLPVDKVMELIGQYSDPMKQLMLSGREQRLGETARTLLPQIQAVYGKPEELKTLLAGVSPEVLQRPEIPWQQMNEELGRQQAGSLSGNRGLAGLLWNVPGMLENAYKGVVNATGRALTGPQAAQYQYTKFTDPFTEVPRYREAQAIMEALNAPGQSVGPAPEGPMGGYTTGPVAQGPEWQYGTGTQGIPEEMIPVPEPMGMPSPAASLLSGGMLPGGGMAPGMALEMLLRKAGLGAAGAEAPFGMPTMPQEEVPPWQYGVGRMR